MAGAVFFVIRLGSFVGGEPKHEGGSDCLADA